MKNSQLTSHSVKVHTLKAPSPHQDQEDKLRHSYCCCESVGESERASERERETLSTGVLHHITRQKKKLTSLWELKTFYFSHV